MILSITDFIEFSNILLSIIAGLLALIVWGAKEYIKYQRTFNELTRETLNENQKEHNTMMRNLEMNVERYKQVSKNTEEIGYLAKKSENHETRITMTESEIKNLKKKL